MSDTVSFIVAPDWSEYGDGPISDEVIDRMIGTLVGLKNFDTPVGRGTIRSAKRYREHNAIVMEVEIIHD